VGVDPALASPEVARAKDTAAAVTWICGDAASVPPFGADLAVMTGNVAQVFIMDDDWYQVLAVIRGARRPGGVVAFETRRPERRAWPEWNGIIHGATRELWLYGMAEYGYATDDDVPAILARATARGCQVRVLLLNPVGG
jgi:SAM-dependent methyltransferase